MPEVGSPEVEALERLESLVQSAGKAIKALRTENSELQEQLNLLQEQVGDSEAWAKERSELAERVSSLADGLEKLIEITED